MKMQIYGQISIWNSSLNTVISVALLSIYSFMINLNFKIIFLYIFGLWQFFFNMLLIYTLPYFFM